MEAEVSEVTDGCAEPSCVICGPSGIAVASGVRVLWGWEPAGVWVPPVAGAPPGRTLLPVPGAGWEPLDATGLPPTWLGASCSAVVSALFWTVTSEVLLPSPPFGAVTSDVPLP
ncbi:hypothetical protein KJK32_02110 [Streptomyces sp. JCM17656]|nr:hypothetical protein KJK32_02110 [Streptomyces sp. JCM17656]